MKFEKIDGRLVFKSYSVNIMDDVNHPFIMYL